MSVTGALVLIAACATANFPPDEDPSIDLPDRVDPGDSPSSLDSATATDAVVVPPRDSAAPDADAGLTGLRVFVSSSMGTGNLGGFTGADKVCNDLAAAAGLPGKYAAWLSYNGGAGPDAINHVTSAGPWKLVSGELVAATKAQLASGTLAHAIDHDEKGVAVTAQKVWTGTGANGQYLTNDCDKWTTGSDGRVGLTSGTDVSWTSSEVDGCGQPRHIYCFGL